MSALIPLRFWAVFWVDVSTPSLAQTGFLDIARRLKAHVSTWEEGRQRLSNLHQPWILILDNADDPGVDYQAYFPPTSSGVVLLTSRNSECKQYATEDSVPLEGLPVQEAIELLFKAAGITPDQLNPIQDDARYVATLLQSHPLALIQAGAYIRQGYCKLAAYPKAFERQRERLLSFRPRQAQSRYRDVYATFEASIEILQASHSQSSQDALQLLPLLAVCTPNQFPLMAFEDAWKGAQAVKAGRVDYFAGSELTMWHVSRLPSFMQVDGPEWDSFRLVEAVNELQSCALISAGIRNEHEQVSMHPLVHAWARDRQDERHQHESWIAMGCALATSIWQVSLWHTHAWQILPHLRSLISWDMERAFSSENTEAVCSIFVKCGWRFDTIMDDRLVVSLLDRLYSHLKLDRSVVDKKWVDAYHLMSSNFLSYDKGSIAVKLLEQVVRIRQTLAEEHPSRRRGEQDLASAYTMNGQSERAVPLLENLVRLEEQILPEHDPDRLSSQRELSKAYSASGRMKEAIEFLEKVLRIQQSIYAEDHPDRLYSEHELARQFFKNGEMSRARQMMEKVVDIEQRVLDSEHPERLVSEHNLATYLWDNGQRSRALQMMEKVVEIFQRVEESDHPDRLMSELNLATYLWDNGQRSRGLQMIEKVVEIYQRVEESDHPDRLVAEHNLATYLWDNGQRSRALQMMEKVVEIYQRVKESDHPGRRESELWLEFMEDGGEGEGEGEGEGGGSGNLPTDGRARGDATTEIPSAKRRRLD